MNSESRTSKSIRNSAYALFFTFLNLILSFFSRKVFLDCLGAEILGLNTTVVNLLQFLNLAELGIGSATTFSLYKPLQQNDINTTREIISLQGNLYKRIASIIIIGALILMAFFPLIFKKISLPLWYAYATFLVMLFSALLGYFVNYKQIILSASQEEYRIAYSYRSVMILKVAVQMALVYTFPDIGYVLWLVIEVLFTIIGSVTLNLTIYNRFPGLKDAGNQSYKELKKKYSTIIVKIKQLFFHNIGIFALSQTSPLIIYAYISLTMVAKYGNYMIIFNGLSVVINSLFNGLGASVGNLVAEGNYDNIKKVFLELFSIRFFIVSVICFSFYQLTPYFIKLWLGEEYILSNSTLIIFTMTLFISLFRSTVGFFIAAYGIFQDIYAPIAEALINISMSILLGHYFGLNGILSGVLISQIIIIAIWKPYFLFTRRMKDMWKPYIYTYIKHMCYYFISWIVTSKLMQIFRINEFGDVSHFCIDAILMNVIFCAIMFSILYFTKSGMDMFVLRLKNRI